MQKTAIKASDVDVRTALPLHKKALSQRTLTYSVECKKLIADIVAIAEELSRIRTVAHSKIDQISTSLEGATKRSNNSGSEHVKVLIFESSVRREPQLRLKDTQEVKILKYRLDGSVTEERRAQKTIGSVQRPVLAIRSDIDKYCQRFPLYTESFMANITDGISEFLYKSSTKVRKLARK